MIVHVITLFPDLIEAFAASSIMGRASEKGLLKVKAWHLRDFADDKHKTVDDTPYGGGAGIVLKPDVLYKAVSEVKKQIREEKSANVPVVLTSPQGRMFKSEVAKEYAAVHEWIVICGHYGGVDQRFIDACVTDEVSIGDYVLTGGELPAMCMIDAASRFIPGVLGNLESAEKDSFEEDLLGYPLYTKPAVFNGLEPPAALLSGHHAEIEKWRRMKRLEITSLRRPDLLKAADMSEDEIKFVRGLKDKKV